MSAALHTSYFFTYAEYEEIFLHVLYTSRLYFYSNIEKNNFYLCKNTIWYQLYLTISYSVCLKYLTRVHTCEDLSVAWDWVLIRRFLTLHFKRIEDVVRCVTVALLTVVAVVVCLCCLFWLCVFFVLSEL